MRKLVATKSFQKKFTIFIRTYPHLEKKVERALNALRRDPFVPALDTHKLSGNLKNFYACRIDYKYRLAFFFDKDSVYLINIGDHDEVY